MRFRKVPFAAPSFTDDRFPSGDERTGMVTARLWCGRIPCISGVLRSTRRAKRNDAGIEHDLNQIPPRTVIRAWTNTRHVPQIRHLIGAFGARSYKALCEKDAVTDANRQANTCSVRWFMRRFMPARSISSGDSKPPDCLRPAARWVRSHGAARLCRFGAGAQFSFPDPGASHPTGPTSQPSAGFRRAP